MEETVYLSGQSFLTLPVIQKIISGQVSIAYQPEIPGEWIKDITENTLDLKEFKSLAMGVGPEVPPSIVKLMLVLEAERLTKIALPFAPPLISRLLEFHQFEILPQVFTQGLQASSAVQLLMPVFGTGKLYFQGYLLKAEDVHDIFSWKPITWPETFNSRLLQYPILSLGYLVYTVIQFKNIISFFNKLIEHCGTPSDRHFSGSNQVTQLENQLNGALYPLNEQNTLLPDLSFQLEKLIIAFGEHIAHLQSANNYLKELSTDQKNTLEPYSSGYLNQLLHQLVLENRALFESTIRTRNESFLPDSFSIIQQPYSLLLNLEKVLAVFTLCRTTALMAENNPENFSAPFLTAYRNKVLSVINESVFAELIHKSVSFMYETVSTNK